MGAVAWPRGGETPNPQPAGPRPKDVESFGTLMDGLCKPSQPTSPFCGLPQKARRRARKHGIYQSNLKSPLDMACSLQTIASVSLSPRFKRT